MDLLWVLWEGLQDSVASVIQIGLIAIPVMVFIEFAKQYRWLDKISILTKPITRLLDLSEHALFPITVGLTFGLVFGAGVIIQSAREGKISLRDLFIVNLFLSICHGIIDETMVFVAIGVNGFVLIGLRLAMALIVTVVVARVFYRKPLEPAEGYLSNYR